MKKDRENIGGYPLYPSGRFSLAPAQGYNMHSRRNRLLVLLLLVLPMLIGACAYFNTFYNAQDYYQRALEAMDTRSATGEIELPRQASDAFGTAIEKSHKVIEKYPTSRYVDEAFFIIGRSHYYRREYGLAERFLQQLLNEYPWSPYSNEVSIWLARVHAEMGLNDAVDADLAPILGMDQPPRKLLTDIYLLRSDMAMRAGDNNRAVLMLSEAAESSTDPGQKAAIYYQLFTLTIEMNEYATALEFLNQFARTTPSEKERVEARLKRVQLLQEMGDLEGAYKEIRNMVSLREFADIIPGLQLELAKIELARGNIDEALLRFTEIIDEHATLPEASESAYRVGVIYLTQLHDIEQAQDFFKRVKRNTTYYQPAQNGIAQITTLVKQNDLIVDLRSKIGLAVDQDEQGTMSAQIPSEELAEEGERAPDTPREKSRTSAGSIGEIEMLEEMEGQPIPEPELAVEQPVEPVEQIIETESVESVIDTAQIRQELAYAMYRLGEIKMFDMTDTSGALEIMADIVSNFEKTDVAAQAAYMLYYYADEQSEQKLFWEAMLGERFPTSPYGRYLSDRELKQEDALLDSLTNLAALKIAADPVSSIQVYRKIRQLFGTEHSVFSIAYLYDEYLADLDSAIIGYDDYLAIYPDGEYSATARQRLEFLQGIKAGEADLSQEANIPTGINPEQTPPDSAAAGTRQDDQSP
jgi:TolA-binding protein